MKKGELVRLKSGGPSMLVVNVERPRDSRAGAVADCVWHAENAVLRQKFPVDALETVDPYQFYIGASRMGLD